MVDCEATRVEAPKPPKPPNRREWAAGATQRNRKCPEERSR